VQLQHLQHLVLQLLLLRLPDRPQLRKRCFRTTALLAAELL